MKSEKTGKMYHLVVPFLLAAGSTACGGVVEPGQELEAVREEPSRETAVKEGAAGEELLGQVRSGLNASVNGCVGEVPRLARIFNPYGTEHLYTQFNSEIASATSAGWIYEGITARIFDGNFAPCGAVPLYRFLRTDGQDRLYTTSYGEVGSNPGWRYEFIQGYCFPTQVAGTIPLYRMYVPSQADHYYTTSWGEVSAAVGQGHNYEGVACHVYPDYADQTVQCNVPVSSGAGGDKPYSVNVNLGAASGAFRFTYDTQSVKDRMIVRVNGVALYDTGCVGQSTSVVLNYSGSTVANVEVLPNCEGTTGTAWSFSVGCP
ncbi:hypothetical protein [Archangium sp.]|uniref:hypothetical protein n=1 Tax=Archangium sp. TaxID=1872627 RepID=UPI00286B4256|nr:hypothetical protein [Archangium sp.]